jgi:hypothetical protein
MFHVIISFNKIINDIFKSIFNFVDKFVFYIMKILEISIFITMGALFCMIAYIHDLIYIKK